MSTTGNACVDRVFPPVFFYHFHFKLTIASTSMKIIKPIGLLRRSSTEEDDIEKQLSPMPLDACTSPSLSGKHIVPKPPQAQLPERFQDISSSGAQSGRSKLEDTVTTNRPKRRRRKAKVAGPNASMAEAEGVLDNDGDEFVVRHKGEFFHSLRKEQLQRVLDPLLTNGSSTLLLCCGQEDRCRIIPVQINDSSDSAAQWNETQRAWNQQNANWRSWLPWRGVKSVTVGQVHTCPMIADNKSLLIIERDLGSNSR